MIAVLILLPLAGKAQDWNMLFDLRGKWKFELGDDKRRAETKYDDSKWETIFAPAKWEDEGFPGYDGYAWYRKHFNAAADWNTKYILLRLGRIDDVDEVYVNGQFIGSSGSFPPAYETAYNQDRVYQIPRSYLVIPGDNVVAVRVYDDGLGGGVYEGRLGIYEDGNALVPDIDLAGQWNFATGDDPSWKEISVNDRTWSKIHVPAYWELQGFPDYDGYAWYRTKFSVPLDVSRKTMVLLLGNIDDFDETYVNGKLVGRTGKIGKSVTVGDSDDWLQLRAYTVPAGQLHVGEGNTIAVRVFDGYKGGGIYRGPIGLVSRDQFKKWQNATREFESGWKDFMLNIFKDLTNDSKESR